MRMLDLRDTLISICVYTITSLYVQTKLTLCYVSLYKRYSTVNLKNGALQCN